MFEKIIRYVDALIEKTVRFVRQAGAASESDTERNGFLSYHAETHALVLGFAAGLVTGVGDTQIFGVILGTASAGLRGESSRQPTKVLKDVYQEPHYALFGASVGLLLAHVV
ncbi:MAG: hypothetical protein ACOCP2_03580 [Halohasta sp.]